MQGANLEFMNKNKFMRLIGFDEVVGNDSFHDVERFTSWGVDDGVLFQEVLKKIDDLETKRKPWFVSVLTIGTHHPHLVPGIQIPSFEFSAAYADWQAMKLLRNLENRGLLENTLVVITGDEASGKLRERTFPEMSHNHGFLAMSVPGMKTSFTSKDMFTHYDFKISILDYLGLNTQDAIGRSLFRNYGSRQRSLAFANAFIEMKYLVTGEYLTICDLSFHCERYRFQWPLFSNENYENIPMDSLEVEDFKHFIQTNDHRP
jgi:phosphoglycerol transferase MdoB-like AlkP superfamily enzyme